MRTAYMLEVFHDSTKVEDWRQFGGLQTMFSMACNHRSNRTPRSKQTWFGA